MFMAACSNSPTAPQRTGVPSLNINCEHFGADPLVCTAPVSCGLYPCPNVPSDVTQSAEWIASDPSILQVVGPGLIRAGGVGDAFVKIRWNNLESSMRPISVFRGLPPLPTFEIFGTVYQEGQTPFVGAINGAVVEVLDGVVAGRQVTTGVPPPLPPGYLGPFGGPGYYRVVAVPPGTYDIRITKAGFASQTRFVTVSGNGGPNADFALRPQ